MRVDEYLAHDAVGLAALVRDGEVSPVDVLEAAIARADEVNPRLNAIIRPMYEEARRRASAPSFPDDAPFPGVPFLLKDLFQDYAGVPTSMGSRAMRNFPAPHHAEIVRRWLDAGLIPFGKTNLPEFGAKGITEPQAFGATRNPWNVARTPGGSSGGSAAAVAAGIVPAAGANDGGGSIRIPAACCGLVGLKAGRGRVPFGPVMGEPMHGAAVNGVVTRTVRDSAALLDAMAGPEPTSPYPIAAPERPYRDEVARDPGRLRIGFTERSPLGTTVHPEAVAAVRAAAALLEGLGHDVEQAEPDIDGRALTEDFLTLWYGSMAALVDGIKAQTGCGEDAFEPDSLMLAAMGRSMNASSYVRCHDHWNEHIRALADFHGRYDLLLTPTIAGPPVPIGRLDPPAWLRAAERVLVRTRTERIVTTTGLVNAEVMNNLTATPFTLLANLTGAPAISLPLHWTPDGLPLGVQFVAPAGGEGLLLRLAGRLEEASPWAHRRPQGVSFPAGEAAGPSPTTGAARV
ncbi:amidase [Nocardiopsis gilva YIM 90087]|uniref:Amidase n=1 Tax=Nocardiopsis gilva YIM 90087 TaxID=1235441 RepID=A0A223S6S8_9ACTN|nr:amidase family protein [Nocardiopsis gilva]ASU83828.1 amidase [Nocardiopsis gilva YIM 90087]